MLREPSENDKAHYLQHGWVKIERFVPPQLLEGARSRIEEFLTTYAHEFSGRDINHVDNTVNSIHRLEADPWFNDILYSIDMMRVAAFFLEDDAEPRKCELFAKPAGVGLPAPMHQDNYLFCVEGGNALTVWIALEPADESNGALYYLDASHRGGIVPHKKSFAPGTSQMVSEEQHLLGQFQVVTPRLQPGDALIHHSEIIHGSNPNTSSRSRRGWTLQYKGRNSSYDQDRLDQYERDLKEQLMARGQMP